GGLATFVFLSRPNRVHLCCGSRVRPCQVRQIDFSIPRWLGYMSEQAIYMVNSFQFTRSARLVLAYRPSGSVGGRPRSLYALVLPGKPAGFSCVRSLKL